MSGREKQIFCLFEAKHSTACFLSKSLNVSMMIMVMTPFLASVNNYVAVLVLADLRNCRYYLTHECGLYFILQVQKRTIENVFFFTFYGKKYYINIQKINSTASVCPAALFV